MNNQADLDGFIRLHCSSIALFVWPSQSPEFPFCFSLQICVALILFKEILKAFPKNVECRSLLGRGCSCQTRSAAVGRIKKQFSALGKCSNLHNNPCFASKINGFTQIRICFSLFVRLQDPARVKRTSITLIGWSSLNNVYSAISPAKARLVFIEKNNHGYPDRHIGLVPQNLAFKHIE